MNIPKEPFEAVFGIGPNAIAAEQLVLQVVSDLALTAAYLLLVFAVVYLNRHKYVSIFVPRRTYGWMFVVVFVLSLSTSMAALLIPGPLVHLILKSILVVLLIAIVAGILAVLPRDIDPNERARLRVENIELKEALRAQYRAETELARVEADMEARLAKRSRALSADTLRLEKELIETKLQEERAMEAHSRLEELILRTQTALVFMDQQGSVLDCNAALPQILGRATQDEVLGRPLAKLLGMRQDQSVEHFIQEVLRYGTYFREIDTSLPDRGIVSIEFNGVTTILDGRTCIMAMMRDVTERRASEKELLQSREGLSAALDVARKANATRSDFLAKMNHELRTPLNGIIGLAEVIRHKSTGRAIAGADARKLATNIHQSGKHLLSVVDDLLDLSRLDAGARELNPVQINVRAEVDAALVTVASIAQKKSVALINQCPKDLDWVVDQRAFKQIMINLVNNAVKFSPAGSRVMLEVTKSAESIALHVRDQGPGIAKRELDRILEPFGRGAYAMENKIDGVGLGLAIVSELLKLQGGRIEIESEVDNGATFTAVLPKGAPARPSRPEMLA